MKPQVYPETCSRCHGDGGTPEVPCPLCLGSGVTTLDETGVEIARPIQRDADGNEIDPNSAAGMLMCGSGDMAFALAFEHWPPAEVLASLPPHDVCPICWPAGAA
jgi:DnaJ-class molecular chaperone